MSDNGNAPTALLPVQRFLVETLASAFEYGLRSRSAFLTIHLDRIIPALQERMPPEQFIKLANEVTGRTFDKTNIGMFRFFCPYRDEAVVERMLRAFTTEDAVRVIPNENLFDFLTAEDQAESLYLSSMSPAKALATPFELVKKNASADLPETETQKRRYVEFVREALKRARRLRLINDQRLAQRIDEAQLNRLSEAACELMIHAAFRQEARLTGPFIIETLVATLFRDEALPIIGDVWAFVIAPALVEHLLGMAEEEKETVPAPSLNAPSPASLKDLAASVPPPIQPPTLKTHDNDPEELETPEPEEETTAARPSRPDAASLPIQPVLNSQKKASKTEIALKVELIDFLQETCGLIVEDISLEDTAIAIASQFLLEADEQAWRRVTRGETSAIAFGDTLCELVAKRHGTREAEQLRTILVSLGTATPIKKRPSKRPPPPRARTNSEPLITVGPPFPQRDKKTASIRHHPPLERPLVAQQSPPSPSSEKLARPSRPPPPTRRRP